MNFSDTLFCAKKGFIHRKITNQDVLISVGSGIADFNGYILLNSTASFLWDMLKEPQNVQDLTKALAEEFDVSLEEAKSDVDEFVMMLLDKGMLEEI
ncbi:MAG: PqqD family protein [Clostridia bacterium]|nr:PqqD family protein [Clostridia bacterium]